MVTVRFGERGGRAYVIVVGKSPSRGPGAPRVVRARSVFRLFLCSMCHRTNRSRLSRASVASLERRSRCYNFMDSRITSIVDRRGGKDGFGV